MKMTVQEFEQNAVAAARLMAFRCEEDHVAAKIMADSTAEHAVPDPRYSLERFKQRLADEDAMKDTETPRLTAIEDTYEIREARKENGLLRRSLEVLTARIEELEAEIDKMRGELVEAVPDLERIASTLRTFYFAPVQMGSQFPILELALELNPDIIEQRR